MFAHFFRANNYKAILMPILRANDSICKKLTLAALVIGLSLFGCVSAPKYPDNWPSLKKTENKCAALTGTYSDIGESAPNQESGEAVSCFRTLFPAQDMGVPPTSQLRNRSADSDGLFQPFDTKTNLGLSVCSTRGNQKCL